MKIAHDTFLFLVWEQFQDLIKKKKKMILVLLGLVRVLVSRVGNHLEATNLDPRRCLKSPVSASVGVVGACAYDCDCGCVNVSGSVCDVCAWAWLCTVVVAVVAVAAAEDEDEDEACARCSRHGPLPLDRSSMISSSPSSTTHHPPAEKRGSKGC